MDKSIEQEWEKEKKKNLDRLSVKSVDFFSGLKAIIDFVVRNAFSRPILILKCNMSFAYLRH
jgi:hypothetical protein